MAEFVRGTLRPDGWRGAWGPVFETLESGDTAAITRLTETLAKAHSFAPGEPDRVAMGVSLRLCRAKRTVWQDGYVLDLRGDACESAMARAVSNMAAIAARDVLDRRAAPGLNRAVTATADCSRWLDRLSEVGIAPRAGVLSTP
ncbi:hypothetical protein [Salipiger aestuarii]|uniref:hypothetical protein n=1 Tax=Salipiger aestuarii TaxID=568098 RepID=UPI00167FF829|nr:hypothetical protein [Salipiger aestuarii]